MTSHGKSGDYLEGRLGPADEEAFLEHLTACAECQADLHGDVQLRDREDALRAAALREAAAAGAGGGAGARVVSLAAARRRRQIFLGLAGAIAAAAVVAVALQPWWPRGSRPGGHAGGSGGTVALAPTRSIEPRLAWAGAAGYRPYDTLRSGTAVASEPIDPRAIATLAEAGDCAGVAATYVLSGELARAEQQYATCGAGPELDADRAALALQRGRPGEALEAADRALAVRPDHPVALWNRALALRDLGLGFVAAATFERAAAVDAAWAAEARDRAAAARAPLAQQRAGYQEVIEAGRRMVAGGPPIPSPLARAFPARARLRLDDAIRVATTRARLDELRPLAAALEGLAGDGLVARLDAARPTTAPPAVIATYVAWIRAGAITDERAWKAWLAAARRARADALLLGAVLISGRAADVPEAAAIAARAGDPAVTAVYEVIAIQALQTGGHHDDAEARLVPLERACASEALPDYPCLRVAHVRATIEYARYRAPATAAATAEVLRLAGAQGEWALRWRALYLAGNAERIRGARGLAIAYYDEYVLEADQCEAARLAAIVAAEVAFDDRRTADARARLIARPACGASSLIELSLEVDLARAGDPVRPLDALLADLEAFVPGDAREASVIAFLAARARLGVDPDATARVRAIAAVPDAPGDDPGRPRLAQLATGALAVEAGRAGRWADVVASVAAWTRDPAPPRCALVLASEDYRFVAVAIDRDGASSGAYEPDRRVDDRRPLPAAITAAIRDCPRLDVVALPPWLGADLGLDPALPWRFGSRAAAPTATGPGHRVVVVEPRPPAALGLAPLGSHVAAPPGAEVLRGDTATVARIAAAARDATLLEIHTHAIRVADSDAPALVLTASPDGWAATAEAIARWSLPRAPVVLLADCDAGRSARYEELHWSLPRAFLDAGAATVVAALVPVPDAEADVVFAQLGDAISAGEPAVAAVARLRAEKIRQDPASWLRHVVVFE